MSSERIKGVTRWFDRKKGFGFIAANNQQYFVYYKEISMMGFKILDEGQSVSFVPVMRDKGWCAEDVQITQVND
jgi:CspA family cold shock protein